MSLPDAAGRFGSMLTAFGALAGIAAGGIAAFLYAFHCTDDSPLFVTLWYTIASNAMAMAMASPPPRFS